MEKETKLFLFLLVPAAWLAKQMVQEIRLVLPFFLSSTTHEIERKSCSPSRRQKIVGGKT